MAWDDFEQEPLFTPEDVYPELEWDKAGTYGRNQEGPPPTEWEYLSYGDRGDTANIEEEGAPRSSLPSWWNEEVDAEGKRKIAETPIATPQITPPGTKPSPEELDIFNKIQGWRNHLKTQMGPPPDPDMARRSAEAEFDETVKKRASIPRVGDKDFYTYLGAKNKIGDDAYRNAHDQLQNHNKNIDMAVNVAYNELKQEQKRNEDLTRAESAELTRIRQEMRAMDKFLMDKTNMSNYAVQKDYRENDPDKYEHQSNAQGKMQAEYYEQMKAERERNADKYAEITGVARPVNKPKFKNEDGTVDWREVYAEMAMVGGKGETKKGERLINYLVKFPEILNAYDNRDVFDLRQKAINLINKADGKYF